MSATPPDIRLWWSSRNVGTLAYVKYHIFVSILSVFLFVVSITHTNLCYLHVNRFAQDVPFGVLLIYITFRASYPEKPPKFASGGTSQVPSLNAAKWKSRHISKTTQPIRSKFPGLIDYTLMTLSQTQICDISRRLMCLTIVTL